MIKHQISQLVGSVSQDQYNLQFKPNNFNKLQPPKKKKKKRFEFKLSLTCSYRIKRLKNNSSQKKKINIS